MSEPATGTVEDVTLRVTRLRSVSGEVITTPSGQIVQVTNLSRDWARAVLDVPVPSSVEVSHVTDILRRAGQDAYGDDRLRKLMLDPPTVVRGRPRTARRAASAPPSAPNVSTSILSTPITGQARPGTAR